MKESACPGDKTTSSFMPSTYVPWNIQELEKLTYGNLRIEEVKVVEY